MTPKRRILIIEDVEPISALMADFLAGEGYEVTCATDGRAALALLAEADPLPDLILLDLMMPGMDGTQFRAAQLAEPRVAGVPIVVMSAGADAAAKARELGAVGFLKKPFKSLEVILAAVDSRGRAG